MRPRSRLLAKKRLPTIREGYEELLQDMNQANSCHSPCHAHTDALSSEAYLQSICQLARPAFPMREPDRDILALALQDSLRLPAHSNARPPTPTTRQYSTRANKATFSATAKTTPHHVHSGSPDPLEYLYGHQNGRSSSSSHQRDPKGTDQTGQATPRHFTRANSFPRIHSPRRARKSSSPDLRVKDSSTNSPPNGGHSTENKIVHGRSQSNGNGTGEMEKSGRAANKQSMISHWIADCHNALREARLRSCMLPAIAEM